MKAKNSYMNLQPDPVEMIDSNPNPLSAIAELINTYVREASKSLTAALRKASKELDEEENPLGASMSALADKVEESLKYADLKALGMKAQSKIRQNPGLTLLAFGALAAGITGFYLKKRQ